MNKIFFLQKSSLFFIGWSFRNWKIAASLQLVKNWNILPKSDKIHFLNQHSQPLYDVLQKDIENLEFVRGVYFEFFDSLKNNGTKYLLIFDDWCKEICNWKAFVGIAMAGRHRGLSQSTSKTTFFTRAN